MKTKIIFAILAAACLGLVVGLFAVKKQGEDRHAADVDAMTHLSNDLTTASSKVDELKDLATVLQADRATNQQQIVELSNSLATAAVTLAESKSSLSNAQEQIGGLNTRIAGLDTQITDLKQQNQALDQRAAELAENLARLNQLIAETRARLATSETNNEYLQHELQKQMAEKAEIEHKFNDLNELRHQVKKIKDDLYTARRLQLMRYDTSGRKGAEMLVTRQPLPSSRPAGGYDLNVEVGSDGSVKMISPMTSTNSAAR